MTETQRGITAGRATVIVVLVGALITAAVSWTAWDLNNHNEHRLLEVQTSQAAAVLSATILGIEDPLQTALQLELATGGSAAQFDRFASSSVGPDLPFQSAVLWKSTGTTWSPVASAGDAPLLDPSTAPARAIIALALTGSPIVVRSERRHGQERIGYAVADPSDPTYALYAERAIPKDRETKVESNSAFADLDYATYLGRSTHLSALATTDLPPSALPMTGDVVRTTIPFGDTVLTLVAGPRVALGGWVGGAVPWAFMVGGTLVTLGAAVVTYLLVDRRRRAQGDALTIAGLYEQLDGLYGDQRSISETLQRALLPQRHPAFPNLEIASRYIAGADGVDIGGDWYSLVELDRSHFGFVVGDVSGKGVGAASIMARLRFTVRAYLVEGHPPAEVLEMCSHQLNVARDGHLATVLVGVGDLTTGTITVASAGHLDPMVVDGSGSRYVPTPVGPPLGAPPSSYRSTTVRLATGATMVAFTDGLVERRGESIDDGLDRLLAAATARTSPDELLTSVTAALTGSGSADDIAVLAFRWWDPGADRAAPQPRAEPRAMPTGA